MISQISQQNAALERLLSHAASHSPYYKDQEWAKRHRSGRRVNFLDIPITSKSTVKGNVAKFYSTIVPPDDGPVTEKATSGSTGDPTTIRKTALHFKVNAAESTRLRAGWGFESHWRTIGTSSPSSEHPSGSVKHRARGNGRERWTIFSYNPSEIVRLLIKTGASLIFTRPSTAIGVLEALPDVSPLRLISTVGEMVQPELHQLLRRLPSCGHFDAYGSVETGIIAGTCSKCGSYHLADQHLIVEVLDEGGSTAPAGTIGRVIATPLYNLAMPLLRYEIGDYAIPQSNIACPASSDGLSEIVGRSLNLFLLPDGSRITPKIANDDLLALGIRKHKMIQVSRVQIDFLYVPISPDITLNVENVQTLIDRNISPLIQARPVRVEEIGPGVNGKYLMHESLVSAP